MKYISTESKDPYYNLALEEYVLLNFKEEDYLLLWNSEKSIVVGKYQNVFEEVNLKEVKRQDIPVLRRISGGGTVYHDQNNLNYSMIMDYDRKKFNGYDPFLEPVIHALNEMGISAAKRRTCDIGIGDSKISGSAQTIKKDRILHHGTLLFDSDLGHLQELLKPTTGKIESKAVKSFPSPVTNIKDHLTNKEMTLDEFKGKLLEKLFPEGLRERVLTEDDLRHVRELANEKYRKWNWNYGGSPKFSFYKEGKIAEFPISVRLDVKDGLMTGCEIKGLYSTENLLDLIGVRYDYTEIKKVLSRKEEFHTGTVNLDDVLDYFF